MDTHTACVVCSRPVCPWEKDGTVTTAHFECPADNGSMFGEPGAYEAVHDHCRGDYVTRAIAKELRAGLEVRHGAELNQMIIGERSNNVAIRVYELLLSMGMLKGTK